MRRRLSDYARPVVQRQTTRVNAPLRRGANFKIDSHILGLLPTFHGLPSEDPYRHVDEFSQVCEFNQFHNVPSETADVSFLCVVKTQIRWSKKIYKTELTKTRYNNQVLGKYRVDPQRAGLTLIAELTWSNLGLKGVLNKRK